MTDSEWQKQGATLSHKNASKEFGLSEDELVQAMKAGKLQYRQNSAHGNPYFRVLRSEVKSLAEELHGVSNVEDQERRSKIKAITKEINSLKRKLSSLEKQKSELIGTNK